VKGEQNHNGSERDARCPVHKCKPFLVTVWLFN